MRVVLLVLERHNLEVEPTDTVAALKSRLHDLLVTQLKKQGRDEVKEVDITITFKDNKLQDDSTLEASGVVEGSVLTVLSKCLAEVHRRTKGVTNVKQAVRELKELEDKGQATAEAYAQALKNASPFDLWCDIHDLGELGAGWVMFFHFVQFLGFMCLVLFVVQLPAYFHYRSFASANLEAWASNTSNNASKPISWNYVTAGNTGPHGSDSAVPWVCALLSALVMLLALPQYSRWQRKIKYDVDKREVDPDDYALFIEGLPKDAKKEEDIKAFVEKHARKGKKTEVVNVVISYDIETFTSILEEMKTVKAELAAEEDERKRDALRTKLKELQKPWSSAASLREALPCNGVAVAVLRSQKEQREAVEEWDTFYEWLMSRSSCLQVNSTKPRFENHVLRITRAQPPSDILWENMGVSLEQRAKSRAKTYAMMTLIFGVCLIVVVGVNKLAGSMEKSGKRGLVSFLPAVAVLSIRLWATLTIIKYTKLQRHMTQTFRDLSLLTKLSLFYVLSYCVIFLLVDTNPFDGDWYSSGGLVSDISSLMWMNSIAVPLFILSGFSLFMRSCLLNRKLDLESPPPGLNQAKLNKIMLLPDMPLPKSFAKVIITFILGFVFMPMWPYAILIAALALLAEYWAYKYQLLRQSKRPYRQGHEVSYGALRIVYASVALFAIFQAVQLEPSLKEGVASWPASIALPLCIAPLLLLCLSFRWKRFLCGGFLCSEPERQSTHRDVDFYVAQRAWAKHQKYHTTNMIYLNGLELINERHKTREWDPKTGNFPEPSAPEASSSTIPSEDPASRSDGATAPGAGTLTAGMLAKGGALADVEEGDGAGTEEADDSEEPAAILVEDPAALALEEMKHEVPLSMLGGDETSDDESGASSDDSDSDSEDLPMGPSLGLRPSVVARIVGLTSGTEYNGTRCKLFSQDASGKWTVILAKTGKKASLQAENLQQQVRIVHLKSGGAAKFNDTVATLLRWDSSLGKWRVELWNGVEATVPAANLRPMSTLGAE